MEQDIWNILLLVFNTLVLQWFNIGYIDASTQNKEYNYPIALSEVFAVYASPHYQLNAQLYWSDFPYSVTNTSCKVRCTYNQDILVFGI